MKKVLVLGGGFAGLEAAVSLRKYGFDVTLISNREYMYIYPISIWIPTREKSFEQVTLPLSDLQRVHGFHLLIDEVVSIHASEQKVVCKTKELTYDYLIIAIGAGKVKHEGIENTLSICGKPEEALQIRERIDLLLQKGEGKIAVGFGGNPKDTSGVRGGPAFELLFNIHHLLKKKGIRDRFALTFFAPMAEPGARMGKKALKGMDLFFQKMNIKKHFGKKIKMFEEDGILFEDDSKVESDFTMFIAGNAGPMMLTRSDLPLTEAGFIRINDYGQVEGFENVYAAGDVAGIEGPDWRAKQGHIAEVMARNVAFNIAAAEKGEKNFRGYREHLNILCVMDSGDGAAFVYRDDKREMMIPMPVVGHWLKKGWGWYFRNSKLGRIPRIPGM